MIKYAIVGSRGYTDSKEVYALVEELLINIDNHFITGGASGVDSWVEEAVMRVNPNRITVVRPIETSQKINYLYRNVEIITMADKIIAFWDGQSRGTKFVINYARARGKDVEVRLCG